MIRKLADRLGRFVDAATWRLVHLPPAALGAAGFVVLAGTVGGGMYAYRTYDYVQHDNDFCLSCHLMKEPWEKFAESRHRGLGCKACHQPTPIQRAKMGLRQVVADPQEIEAHADVPQERCTHCHVEGDPEKWPIVDELGGHKVHLSANGPALANVTCLTCHTQGVHEFQATNGSCGAAGCHQDVEVRLGAMADLNLQCVACHDFSRPLPTGGEEHGGEDAGDVRAIQRRALVPDAETCLACHEMRSRVAIDPDVEPHGGVCGTCHNAHDQVRAVDALQNCTQAACHSHPEEFPDRHHQWKTIDLENCSQCHEPHRFKVDGDACLACHDDIVGPAAERIAPPEGGRGQVQPFPSEGETPSGPAPPADDRVNPVRSWPAAPTPADSLFEHARHRSVDCRTCHAPGAVVEATDRQWCASCHHRNRTQAQCATCHQAGELGEVEWTTLFRLPGGPDERPLLLPHERHSEVPCSECHGSPPAAVPQDFSCDRCHDEHHTADEVTCLACHRTPPTWAHEAELVHKGCGGGVCHKAFDPTPQPPARSWTRATCIACHADFIGRDTLPELPGRRGGF